MSERQIEMVWPCHCGTKNLGRHMKCQTCGRPKDDSVEYEMPEDVENAASVTDEKLLRMATAGENWHCAYCGSDQRALDGSCGQCGAGRAEKANQARAAAQTKVIADRAPPRRRPMLLFVALIVSVFLVGTCAVVSFHKSGSSPVHEQPNMVSVVAPAMLDLDLTVTRVHWKRTIATDRWQLVDREGFDPPDGAVDKKKVGDRVHHQEQVLDHMETVYDSVEVPDGTRTESYTEHVACGQSCTTSPRSCRQSCTSNKNGFATCKDVCTGGNQSCTTKYCDETRTRSIPKTRTERRPRQEPRYRSEPRYAPFYAYKQMDWVQIASIDAEGTDLSPAWPDAGASLAVVDGGKTSADANARTQERRTESLEVTLVSDKGVEYTYAPSTPDELATYAPQSHHKMRAGAGVSGAGGPVFPVP